MTDYPELTPADLDYIRSAKSEFRAEAAAIVDRLGLSHLKVAPKAGIPISEVLSRYASRQR